jgi:hypothetical protein
LKIGTCFSFQGFGSGFTTTLFAKFAKIPAFGFALSLVSSVGGLLPAGLA